MDGYREQTVSGESSGRQKWLYALCWVIMAALTSVSIFCAAGFLAGAELSGNIQWGYVVLTVLCLGAVLLLWRLKDRIYVEYDYIFRNEALEIWAILNRRKRRRREIIQMDWVRSIEAPPSPVHVGHGERREAWHMRPEGLCCIHYIKDNIRHAALLELNGEMLNCLRSSKRLDSNVWRYTEGKF